MKTLRIAIAILMVASLAMFFPAMGNPALEPPPSPQQEQEAELKICKPGESPCIMKGALTGVIGGRIHEIISTVLLQAVKEGAVAAILLIDSPGGSFEVSAAIYETLRASPIPVYCFVPKLAASGAFWALQGCTERIAFPSAKLLAHHPSISPNPGMSFTAAELRIIIEELDTIAIVMETELAKRMKMPLDKLQNKLDKGDWVMTSTEALQNNAIDKVLPTVAAVEGYVVGKHPPKVSKKKKQP